MIINPYLFGFSYDPDAQAFITAAGITDTTQKSAINQLVVDLKGYSIWTKFKAIYPFVGGTATTHKWNLINPLDTDAAFRLVFFGSITHDANGITGNGTNGYFDTKLIPSTTLSQNDAGVTAYSRTNLARNGDVFVSTQNAQFNSIFLNPRNSSDQVSTRLNSDSTGGDTATNTNSNGCFTISRQSSANYKVYRNGNLIVSHSVISTGVQTTSIWGMRSTTIYSQRNQCFLAFHTGLNSTEVSTLNTIIQNFQTTLSRQV